MISLNYRDTSPIYEQIKNGLKKLIVTGALKEGDKLPSVRSLDMDLAINPNTIQKAYNELENEGFIYSVPGKGSFASGDVKVDERHRQELLCRLQETLAELRFLGMTDAELLALLREGEEDAP